MDIPSYILGRIKGSGGAGVNYVVVEELPTVGEEGTIYLVPKEDSKTDNVYNEYMYIEDEWELIGDTQADLTDYLKEEDLKTINGNSIVGSGDIKTEIIQYSTVPTASADTVGKIIQYTGTTDSTYTNGYFYQCVSDGQDPATYSWENINVQNSSSGGNVEYLTDTNGNKLYFVAIKSSISSDIETTLKPIAQKVVDDYENNIKSGIFILDTNTFSNTGAYYISAKSGIQYLFTSNGNFATSTKTQSYTDYYVSNMGFRARFSGTTITDIVSYGTIGNRVDMYCLETNVNYSQPYTPTYNGSPVTKLYTDKTHYENMAGYDATKTQVLKNVQGVLTWITEE